MKIVNVTEHIPGQFKQRALDQVSFIMIHRVGWPSAREWARRGYSMDAMGVAKFYSEELGWNMPYTFTVSPDGTVQQARPLKDITNHALIYNEEAVAIGVLGDFQVKEPTDAQEEGLVDLLAALTMFWPDARIVGHTHVPNSTNDKNKVCPGENLDVGLLTLKAHSVNEQIAGEALIDAGVTF